MGSTSRIRLRRSAAQLHALAQIEREIRAADPHGRRKYLREFNDAFHEYEKVLNTSEFEQAVLSADLLLVGDYHALPRSQEFAAQLIQQLAETSDRPVVLGVETLFARDQHILDEWQRGEIDECEFRERIRYDLEWGYDWQPFCHVLKTARAVGAKIYGLDVMPRGDLRRIGQRDRHAADKLAEIHLAHPDASVVVLFGESHLAPQHLPALVHQRFPRFQVLTVLQNHDELYWKAAGEATQVKYLRVQSDVICVFNSSPLEKYESYRQCIERWRQEKRGTDLAPSFYNLIDALAAFLRVEKAASNYNSQPGFLYDIVPEICYRSNPDALKKLLERKRATDVEIREAMARMQAGGAAYLQRLNIMCATRYDLVGAGEEVARFLYSVCRGEVGKSDDAPIEAEQHFYSECLQQMAAYVGSRILHPSREPWHEVDLYSRYSDTREHVETSMKCGYREYMRMIDFMVLHKDFECNARRYRHIPDLIAEGRTYDGERFRFVTTWLGRMLGTQVYEAFVSGRLHKRFLRSVLSKRLLRPGEAKAIYFMIARRTRSSKPSWIS
jgi:uncharacterized iron-regulated protein